MVRPPSDSCSSWGDEEEEGEEEGGSDLGAVLQEQVGHIGEAVLAGEVEHHSATISLWPTQLAFIRGMYPRGTTPRHSPGGEEGRRRR